MTDSEQPNHVSMLLTAFDSSMKVVWPNGAANEKRHRDMCRVFILGYVEALALAGFDEIVDALLTSPTIEVSKEPDWSPGLEWVWWDDDSNGFAKPSIN